MNLLIKHTTEYRKSLITAVLFSTGISSVELKKTWSTGSKADCSCKQPSSLEAKLYISLNHQENYKDSYT